MIYILHAADGGPIKIGCSNTPQSRALVISGLFPYRIEILATFEGCRREEKFLHECFRPVVVQNACSDEWFRSCPSIWRFILDVMDNGRPEFLPDLSQKPERDDAVSIAVRLFGGAREAMDQLGYAPSTSMQDTYNMSSGISAGIFPKLLFVDALRNGRIPDYIADLHPIVGSPSTASEVAA